MSKKKRKKKKEKRIKEKEGKKDTRKEKQITRKTPRRRRKIILFKKKARINASSAPQKKHTTCKNNAHEHFGKLKLSFSLFSFLLILRRKLFGEFGEKILSPTQGCQNRDPT